VIRRARSPILRATERAFRAPRVAPSALVAPTLFVAAFASACAGGELPTALAADPSNDAALGGLSTPGTNCPARPRSRCGSPTRER